MLRTQRQVQCDRSEASADASSVNAALCPKGGHKDGDIDGGGAGRLFGCCGPARWGRFEVVWKRRRHLVTGSEVLAEVGGSPSAPHFTILLPHR
jgi:hypothetical protein